MFFTFEAMEKESREFCEKISLDSDLKKFFEERFSTFENCKDQNGKIILGKFYTPEESEIVVKTSIKENYALVSFLWEFEGTNEENKKLFGIGFYGFIISTDKPMQKEYFSKIPEAAIFFCK